MKSGWSKSDKIETDCKKVHLKNIGLTVFKFKSVCGKQMVNNA